jgi:hypothetical protein
MEFGKIMIGEVRNLEFELHSENLFPVGVEIGTVPLKGTGTIVAMAGIVYPRERTVMHLCCCESSHVLFT